MFFVKSKLDDSISITVKLGDKERFDKYSQTWCKESFPVTKS